MSDLNIIERNVGDVTVLNMDGNIAIGEGCSTLQEIIRRLLSEGKKKILLNMSDVGYLDAKGIGVLVSALTETKKNGGLLKLSQLQQKVIDILRITQLLGDFQVFETDGSALDSYKQLSLQFHG